jgi:isopentenyldiphosphate isomerase
MDVSAELLDVYDVSGSHIGVAPRGRIHAEGLWHKTSQVWLINERREVLLQLRASTKDCFPDRWDISSAGHIPAGIQPLESAVRELEEELGVSVLPSQLKFLFNHSHPYIGENHIDREIAYVYLLEVSSSIKLTLQEEEVSDIRWLPYKDLLSTLAQEKDFFVPHEQHFLKLISKLDFLYA